MRARVAAVVVAGLCLAGLLVLARGAFQRWADALSDERLLTEGLTSRIAYRARVGIAASRSCLDDALRVQARGPLALNEWLCGPDLRRASPVGAPVPRDTDGNGVSEYVDAWNGPIRVEVVTVSQTAGNVVVRSAGPNGVFGDADDVVDCGEFSLPKSPVKTTEEPAGRPSSPR